MPRKFGWVPDTPDSRDHMFSAPAALVGDLPARTNLWNLVTQIYDQGDLGSCTANAIGQSYMMLQKKQGVSVVTPSRLFLYYNERKMEGTINEDSGAMIRDGMKSAAKEGICHEITWPYITTKFTNQPPERSYREALDHQILRYVRVVPTEQQIRACLVEYPVVFGFQVFESFDAMTTGNAPLPGDSEVCLGGHAVLAIGANFGPDNHLKQGDVWPSRTILCVNSWGRGWGLKTFPGCFTLPIEYLTNRTLADDFWAPRLVES